MAVAKVCGIETEYGIHARRGTGNPVASSSLLVNAYVAELDRRTGGTSRTSPRATTPAASPARGRCPPRSRPISSTPCSPTGPGTTSTTPTPSSPTPECADPLEVVLYDKAGEEVLRRSMVGRAPHPLPEGQSIVVYKNNSDGKGNSYGTHENYLMDRAVPFARIAHLVTPHFVTRQIYTGAGKVGSETAGHVEARQVPFQLSQRAEFFEEEIGLETTLKRPIVNTRDEPHADPQRYRRLHVIVGDANLCGGGHLLEGGDDRARPGADRGRGHFVGVSSTLANPVKAIRQVSADLTVSRPLDLADGRTITALEIQWELFGRPSSYAEDRGEEMPRQRGDGRKVLQRWEDGPARTRDRPERSWRARWTGWPSCRCSRPTGPPRRATGTTTDWPRSTSSTTTCGRSGRCSPGSTSSAWWTSRGPALRDRAAPPTPAPISGASA